MIPAHLADEIADESRRDDGVRGFRHRGGARRAARSSAFIRRPIPQTLTDFAAWRKAERPLSRRMRFRLSKTERRSRRSRWQRVLTWRLPTWPARESRARPLHDRRDAVRRDHGQLRRPGDDLDRRAGAVARTSASARSQMGYIFSAFGWSYVLGQIPGGWLLDRFGSKTVYFWSIFIWSLFTLLPGRRRRSRRGRVPSTALFAAASSGRAWRKRRRSRPTAAIVAAWFPANERGTASAIFNSAQYFATVLFAPIMGWITHRVRLAVGVLLHGRASASSSASSGSRSSTARRTIRASARPSWTTSSAAARWSTWTSPGRHIARPS